MVYLAILIYNALFPIGFLLYLPFYMRKLMRRGGWRDGFGERFGVIGGDKRARIRALRAPIWVHAVSVGEVQAALGFIRAWQEREPGRGFVLSTTTSTGQAIARDKAPEHVVPIYFPLDVWICDLLALVAIRPTLLVIFEKEFWPTMMLLCRLMRVPRALVNGMMSDRSHRRYAKWRVVFGPVFRWFDAICVQTETDAARVRAVTGPCDRIHVCNTMKFDQTPDPHAADVTPLLDRVFPAADRVLLVAASTHPGEEAVMIRSFCELRADHPQLRLVLVPRHHERTADVVGDLDAASLAYVLRNSMDTTADRYDVPVLLVNTTGELMAFLAAADIVYVGKTLAGNTGGHNIIEPAIHGKAIITGEKTENFRPVMEAFRADAACIEVADEAAFTAACRRLLADPAARDALGAAARATLAHHRGATPTTIAHLQPLAPGT